MIEGRREEGVRGRERGRERERGWDREGVRKGEIEEGMREGGGRSLLSVNENGFAFECSLVPRHSVWYAVLLSVWERDYQRSCMNVFSYILFLGLRRVHAHKQVKLVEPVDHSPMDHLQYLQSLSRLGEELGRLCLLLCANGVCESLVLCNGAQVFPALFEVLLELLQRFLLFMPVHLREKRKGVRRWR